MKRFTRFSIAKLLAITAVFAVFLARYQYSTTGLGGFLGVWQVEQGVDNTATNRIKLGGNVLTFFPDTQDSEIVITSNRLFFVSVMGTQGYEILNFELGDETKLQLRGLGTGLNTYAILRRSGTKMAFAFVDSKTVKIDDSVNGNQIVYTAHHVDPSLK